MLGLKNLFNEQDDVQGIIAGVDEGLENNWLLDYLVQQELCF